MLSVSPSRGARSLRARRTGGHPGRAGDWGLGASVVTRAQLEQIADEAAGVARVGIQSLRAAAELAADRGHDRIQDGDIDDSFERARHDIRAANLRSLPYGPQVVYELVRCATGGAIRADELQEAYQTVAPRAYRNRDEEPVGDRQIRNYLTKLVEYDLVKAEGPNNQWREYRAIESDLAPAVDFNHQFPP